MHHISRGLFFKSLIFVILFSTIHFLNVPRDSVHQNVIAGIMKFQGLILLKKKDWTFRQYETLYEWKIQNYSYIFYWFFFN